MQNRQHGAIALRIQEVIGLPATFERTGLRLAISHDANHEQIRVIEGSSESVQNCVSQLAALVNGIRQMRTAVTRHAARSGKLPKKKSHSGSVLGDF